MKRTLMLTVFSFCMITGFSQTEKAWTAVTNRNIKTAKTTRRLSFPTEFKLFRLDADMLRQKLQNTPARSFTSQKLGVIISLPDVAGNLQKFEVFEASNFTPELQAQFPNIRSYAGKGIDDPKAVLRMSVDGSGIQAMIFRTDKRTEFIEAYSEDGNTYAVYNSSRNKGSLPFTCSTEDKIALNKGIETGNTNRSNTAELLTFRLALSCNAEYTSYFGGVTSALAAMNATMTRVNGIFENDFAIHMSMIDNTAIIYTNPDTDPYTSINSWNGQLQNTLTSVIGEANYDVGHMFGANGGGGDAGCIGCVCKDGEKGSGITSYNVPMGDNFDIDYVAHELGHQFGANHTFSNDTEEIGVNVEPGSGSTIMGYAGITYEDIAAHSDDYFVYASIKQVQDNMVGKNCPVRTPLTNTPPLVNAGPDYIIPISTPFVLTGTGSDADAITYCWEQNDSASGPAQTGGNSQASPTKTGGPNWRSYDPVSSPSRYFPPLARVVQNQLTSVFSGITTEAVSSVARVLNFALTVRDNNAGAGQTNTDLMKVTTTAAAGPFLVTAPNTAVSYISGSIQNVKWNVAGTTANGVNAATVDLFLSTDGGLTYPISLASNVPNDGSETVIFPEIPGTTNRVMVKGHDHVFYDISNTNFTIKTGLSTFTLTVAGEQTKSACQGTDVSYNFDYVAVNGFTETTIFTVSGQPTGTTVTFSTNPIAVDGVVTVQLRNTVAAAPGLYPITVTATSGTIVKTLVLQLQLFSAAFENVELTSPTDEATTQNTSLTLSWETNTNATSYDVMVALDEAMTMVYTSGTATGTSFALNGLSDATTYYWSVKPKNTACEGSYGEVSSFQTGQQQCNSQASVNVPVTIPSSSSSTVNSTLVIPAGSGVAISDLNVTVNISHTWVNDLTATLISPAGTQVRLVAEPCDNAALNDIMATFDDAGIALVCSDNPAIDGTIKSVDLLSAFNGENTAGTWTLRVEDSFSEDGGAINSWSLGICTTVPLGIAEYKLTDFVIYPNPNNGNFRIQFKTNTSDDVKVNVHDIRGRQIFEHTYKSSGLFSEDLKLNNPVPGIYLITVEKGNSKEVRKIVIE